MRGRRSTTSSDFRQLGSPCAGHPENFLLDGVEATTGPLGQGLAMAVGMAIAERHLNAESMATSWSITAPGSIAGDGCLMEGINHEAAGLAGHLGLGRLIVLWDDNRITIDGSTDLSTTEDVEARYAAYGWHTRRCDGLDAGDVRRAIDEALADPRPSLIACRTIIGFGAPTQAGHRRDPRRRARRRRGRRGAQGARLGLSAVRDSRRRRRGLARGRAARRARRACRMARAGSTPATRSDEFIAPDGGQGRPKARLDAYLDGLIANPQKVATRKASELALEAINACAARDDRRLGRPDRLEQHQNQGPEASDRTTIIPAATSITASASSAWRRR